MLNKLNQRGAIAPGTGPSWLDVTTFGFILWLVFMGIYFVAVKIITGHFFTRENNIGFFIGIIGTYFLAWVIDHLVSKVVHKEDIDI